MVLHFSILKKDKNAIHEQKRNNVIIEIDKKNGKVII